MDRQSSGVRDFEEAGIKKAPRPDNFFREINKSIILNKEGSVIAATPSEKTTIISLSLIHI